MDINEASIKPEMIFPGVIASRVILKEKPIEREGCVNDICKSTYVFHIGLHSELPEYVPVYL